MADVECFSSSDADAEPIDIPGCKCTLVALTARTPRSLPVSHSQHGDLPRSIPCPGGLLLLQHDSQYVSLPPVLPCSADSVIPNPVFGFLILLLVLALRQHRQGTKHVWVLPVTMISWFGRSGRNVPKLPPPVTHRSRSQSRRPAMTEKEKPRARSQSRPADVRRNDSQRALLRDDSYRTTDSRRPLNRDDSYRTTDSRRPLNRDDSYRTTDSRPRDLRRDDSRRTNDSSRRADLRRDDSRRTNPGADVRRDDSRRTNPGGGETRRLGPQRGTSPTRNEAPTYVYWIPHKSPEEAHTRETRRAPARDSKFFGLASRR